MQYVEFIEQVKSEAALASQKEAEKATQATLETLGERISKTEREDLASELPPKLRGMLFQKEHHGRFRKEQIDRFSLEEFYKRVSARMDVGYHDAASRTRAVIKALQMAVSSGELKNILYALPEEYDELFGELPKSPLSPSV